MRQNHNLCIDLKLFYSELVFMTLCFVESITVEECELLFMHEIFKHQMSVVSSVCAVPVWCTGTLHLQPPVFLVSSIGEVRATSKYWLPILIEDLTAATLGELGPGVTTERYRSCGHNHSRHWDRGETWVSNLSVNTLLCNLCNPSIQQHREKFTIAGKVLKIFWRPSTLRSTVFHVSPTDWDHWEQNMSWIQDF